jgi:predicted RNA binding protein YcfA (HicA-like mRNA interferase family)
MSIPFRKDVGQFIKQAKCHGFHVVGMTGSGHWKLRHTSGATLIVPATPGGGSRWRRNLESTMKRIVNQEKTT